MQNYETPHTPIKQWDPKDRPREKMLANSASELSNAELLAIIIGSGCGKLSAVDLACTILSESQNNLGEIACKSPKELIRKFKGIGQAKALSILASLELGKRNFSANLNPREKISSSQSAFQFLCPDLAHANYEIFQVLLLSRSNHLLRKVTISQGGLSGTIVDAKKVFKIAIDEHCCGIILAHNHPSGNLSPSKEDIDLTQKLCDGAALLDIRILDHLIISGNKYFSFTDQHII
ncbi:MAG: DNA repair protein RadC [Bacteroidales bacterium]